MILLAKYLCLIMASKMFIISVQSVRDLCRVAALGTIECWDAVQSWWYCPSSGRSDMMLGIFMHNIFFRPFNKNMLMNSLANEDDREVPTMKTSRQWLVDNGWYVNICKFWFVRSFWDGFAWCKTGNPRGNWEVVPFHGCPQASRCAMDLSTAFLKDQWLWLMLWLKLWHPLPWRGASGAVRSGARQATTAESIMTSVLTSSSPGVGIFIDRVRVARYQRGDLEPKI